MKAQSRFSDDLLNALGKSKGVRIRAGAGAHRFIGIWFVVVEDRVFVRSWSVKPGGWYRTFLNDPRGAIQVGDHELRVHAVPVKNERLRSAVDQAYLRKYNTTGAIEYARDLAGPKSRATTMELLPDGVWGEGEKR
jgi:hypothetical protein